MSPTQVAPEAADSPASGDAAPDLSVVVIVYNGAGRLPRAVRSVLDQSLRSTEVVIVDDRSQDDSYQVARQLAAEHPGRVRALQLPANSGGCGAPRNLGVAAARGRLHCSSPATRNSRDAAWFRVSCDSLCAL